LSSAISKKSNVSGAVGFESVGAHLQLFGIDIDSNNRCASVTEKTTDGSSDAANRLRPSQQLRDHQGPTDLKVGRVQTSSLLQWLGRVESGRCHPPPAQVSTVDVDRGSGDES